MRAFVLVGLAGLGIFGCEKNTATAESPAPSPSASAAVTTQATTSASAPADPGCGMRPGDWCPSPPGDPCGAHKDVASCKADSKCKGMRYRGESMVACKDDGTGFTSNCPTVGCISR